MNLAVIGSGGREHALCYKLKQSQKVKKLICIPGNGGTQKIAKNIKEDILNFEALYQIIKKQKIDIVVIGPEQPLVDGLVDYLNEKKVRVFGPDRFASQLEGSKAFMKNLCKEYKIPTASYGVFDDLIDTYKGPHNNIWSHQFYESDASRGFVRGFIYESIRGYGPVGTGLIGTALDRIRWGSNHHDDYRRLFNHTTFLMSICEDLPDETNTVTLDDELKDSSGIPAPKIFYRISENSERMLNFSIDRATEVLIAAGAKDVFSRKPIAEGGWHLLGTARLGSNPKSSVVNEWGRSHDVKNLFIVDGSIFVTSGGVNPTCTIQALALYIADNIKRRLANLFD